MGAGDEDCGHGHVKGGGCLHATATTIPPRAGHNAHLRQFLWRTLNGTVAKVANSGKRGLWVKSQSEAKRHQFTFQGATDLPLPFWSLCVLGPGFFRGCWQLMSASNDASMRASNRNQSVTSSKRKGKTGHPCCCPQPTALGQEPSGRAWVG